MANTERPSKRAKLLDDSEDSDIDTDVKLGINEEFAKRFEHNKKREEKHRLEEKYKDDSSFKRKRADDDEDSEEDSEDDESEDDDALLATEDVDDEIMATLQAIKSKDPRVYDQTVKFFKEFDPEQVGSEGTKKEKPMYLQDYHRENLLAGRTGADEEEEKPQTYAEEQEQLKRELVGSMHAAGTKGEDDEDDFMVAKKKARHEDLPAVKTSKPRKKITDDDIKTADKDPETYLSNFMAARAWLPGDGSRWEAFESDDSDDDKRADEFEEAYNMRFEDPKTANEKLQSFARDVGKYGVRREEKSGRAKAREREKERKEDEKRERDEEKARLRKLKIEEAEEKVKKIKDAAGIRGHEALNLDEWRDVIEGDFDDEKWEAEMKRRFGDQYYEDADEDMGSGDEDAESKKPHKPKKPEWDDDIDIGDLIPDFDDDDKPNITLTDDEDEEAGGLSVIDDEDASAKRKKKNKKDREKEKADAKRTARKERMQIEEMVDSALPLHEAAASSSNGPAVGFRYRETSPTAFGLSARDILFADDSALNQYAGLKKMAAFRDEEKKRKDKKRYSKKQRLKLWRKETFGKVDEPEGGFEKVLKYEEQVPVGDESNVKEGARKKKRSKGKKSKSSAAGDTVGA